MPVQNSPAAAETEQDQDDDQEEEDKEKAEPKEEDPDKIKPVAFIGLFILTLFCLGAFDLVHNMEENGCAMTYMYELPVYVRINLSESIAQAFPKYGLYAYGEGKMAGYLENGKFSGIPVLFIPGNSGSYKQVRSMASVALRKAMDDTDYKVHFDYFAVDFGEELSALYGAVLEQQAEFAASCVEKILQMYQHNKKQGSSNKATLPSSVVLIGHSLGGLVAKSLVISPRLKPASIQIILTLATPHTPVLLMDAHAHTFYEKVNSYWSAHRSEQLAHITLVSLGGGARDLQVRSSLTQDNHSDINAVTTALSSVWVSTDHRCIVWCKQLMLTLNRALFDMIGPVTKQITLDRQLREDVLHYHLLHRSAGKEYESQEKRHPATIKLDTNGYWSDMLKRQFTFAKGNATCNHYVMIRVSADVNHRFLTLDAVKMENKDWIFGCKETRIVKNTKVCDEGENLSGLAAIIPSKGKRKAVHLDMHEIKEKKGYSHIVVHTPVHAEDTLVNMDLYDPRERALSYMVPKWITFWRSYTILERTVPGAVFYNISLQGMEQPWQAYHVTVEPVDCQLLPDTARRHYGLARFVTPWALDTTQVLLGKEVNFSNTLTAKLQSVRPQELDPAASAPQIHLYLDPQCVYTIRIQVSMAQIMGQMLRFYGPMLPAYMVMMLIMILAFQMRRFEGDGYCKSSLLVLMASVSPINVVLPSRMAAYALASLPLALATIMPQTDIALLQAYGLDFGLLPIMLCFCGIGLVFLTSCLLWAAILLAGSLAHKAALAYFARHTPHEIVADLAVSSLARFPAILGALLIALGVATCGSLALCLGCFCYFLKLFKMYEEYLDSLIKRSFGLRKEDDPSMLSGLNFQFTLSLLWLLSALLNLPTLLAWVQNLDKGVALPADPSLLHCIILSCSLSILWRDDGKPAAGRAYYSVLALVLHGLAVSVAVYGTLTLYRIPFAISAVFVAVSTHQLISPAVAAPANEEEEEATAETAVDSQPQLGGQAAVEAWIEGQQAAPSGPSAATTASAVSSSSSDDAQDVSDGEYEYKYQLKVTKRRIKKDEFAKLQISSSQATDTGLGSEGLDWDLDSEDNGESVAEQKKDL